MNTIESKSNIILNKDIGVTSYGIWHIKHLQQFLQAKPVFINRFLHLFKSYSTIKTIVAWGRKPSYYKAQAIAHQLNANILTLEDGFLRSIGLGKDGFQPISMVMDDIGIYFDASQPSKLEQLIQAGIDETERAQAAIASLCHYQLSKYNHAPVVHLNVAPNKTHVLVVDQTVGDQSILLGGANVDTFKKMLTQAIADNPDACIWVKTHPDVTAGKASGYLSNIPQLENIHLLCDAMNPIALLKQMDKVYVVTSHLGFEALMLGKTVHCFGMPFYAGWGLTEDISQNIHRTRYLSIDELLYVTLIEYLSQNPYQQQNITAKILSILARLRAWVRMLYL